MHVPADLGPDAALDFEPSLPRSALCRDMRARLKLYGKAQYGTKKQLYDRLRQNGQLLRGRV